jgi:hypothetical protein
MQNFTQLIVEISAPGNIYSDWGFRGVSQESALDTPGSGQIPQRFVKMLTRNDDYNARDNNDNILKNTSFNPLSIYILISARHFSKL